MIRRRYRRMVRRVLAPAALCLFMVVSACSEGNTHSLIGYVSTLEPSVCVAAPAATGKCFPAADPEGLRFGDCVKVDYREGGALIRLRPTAAPANGACSGSK